MRRAILSRTTLGLAVLALAGLTACDNKGTQTAASGASAATMAALREQFGNQHVMELLATGAFYCAVARIVNALGCELEPEASEYVLPPAA